MTISTAKITTVISPHTPSSHPLLSFSIPKRLSTASLSSMASVPPLEGAPNAYDEAEQGTLEAHSGPTTVSAPESINEKTVDGKEVDPSQAVIFPSEIIPVNNATTSEPPVKRKVSKWILWSLWFNTYRYVSIMSASRVSDFVSGHTH